MDSLRVDGDGNAYAYAALAGEGRVVVLNPKGAQIGQILIPDRDRGEFPFTISMAIKPGTRELHILSSDYPGRRAKIYRAGGFAKAAIPPVPETRHAVALSMVRLPTIEPISHEGPSAYPMDNVGAAVL